MKYIRKYTMLVVRQTDLKDSRKDDMLWSVIWRGR